MKERKKSSPRQKGKADCFEELRGAKKKKKEGGRLRLTLDMYSDWRIEAIDTF